MDCSPPGTAPSSMGFPRQEYRSGLPFPSLGDLPNPGTEALSSVWQGDSLPLSHREAPQKHYIPLSNTEPEHTVKVPSA